MSQIHKPLHVYLPDTRGVELSRYGKGNLKIGMGVYTYSRLPGITGQTALGLRHLDDTEPGPDSDWRGTCPGATEECQQVCYASRPVAELGPVSSMWLRNTMNSDVPPIPEDAKLLRLHVGGDFDSVEYIANWYERLAERPDVRCWVYTRSWRTWLLPALERLRALPNVQMFASMDKSTPELPPAEPYCSCGYENIQSNAPTFRRDPLADRHSHDCVLNLVGWQPWRRAWIDGDPRAGETHEGIKAHTQLAVDGFQHFELQQSVDGTKALICPEETNQVPDCEHCGFCISGLRNDVVFLLH